jgi:large repetitive protein
MTFLGTTGTLELNTAGTLTVTNALAIGANTVKLDGAGATFTDASGATISTGTISGQGVFASTLTASGAAFVTANGGTLEMQSAITDSGSLLTLSDTASTDTLKLDAAGNQAHTLTLNGGTLMLNGNTAALTVGTQAVLGAGKVTLAGTGATFTDASGATISTGTISGQGVFASTLTASNAAFVTANGGTLEMQSAITDSGSLLTLSDAAGTATLELDAAGNQANTLTLNGGTLLLDGNTASLTLGTQAVLAAGKVTLAGTGATFTDASGAKITTGTISGQGVFASTLTASGAAFVTANGGTLEVQSAITDSGSRLTLSDTASTDTLKLDAAGNQAHTLTLNGGTLLLNGNTAALTVGTQAVLGAGKVTLAGTGATFTDASGATISTGTISGQGKFASTLTASGAASVTANGGTLEVTGAITNTGTLALTVGSGASDKLLLDAASAATSVTFSGTTGTLELNTAGTLTVTNALAIGANTVKLDGAGTTQLTDTAANTIAGGTISGTGTIAANTSITGSGTISIPISTAGTLTASGGTLDLTGTVSGRTLAIANVGGSILKIDGTATTLAATSIAIANNTQTLEIGAAGSLTISAAESITNGTIKLDGGTALLTDASGLTIGAGATLTGAGKVTANIATGTGTITASGGTLNIAGNIGSSISLDIGSGATLELGGTSTSTVTFQGSTGKWQIDSTGGTAFSLNGGGSLLPAGDVIDLPNIKFSLAADSYNSGISTITVSDGAGHTVTINVVGGIGSGNTFTFQQDAGTGTEVFDPPVSSGASQGVSANAGQAINLALTAPDSGQGSLVTATINDVPAGWVVNGGTKNADGSWTVATNDVSSLTITTPATYSGAALLHVAETWTQADGTTASATVTDQVEAYARGLPIFALAGDDHLTGTGTNDLFVFAQPIGHDDIYNFNPASDKIDLIGFGHATSLGDIQAHLADDANGNAVITLGDGQSITLHGIDASLLTAGNFAFDQTPVTDNAGTITIGDGAMLPLSGTIDNTGSIALNSTGDATNLQLIEHGVTLDGGGQVILSDNSQNFISGNDRRQRDKSAHCRYRSELHHEFGHARGDRKRRIDHRQQCREFRHHLGEWRRCRDPRQRHRRGERNHQRQCDARICRCRLRIRDLPKLHRHLGARSFVELHRHYLRFHRRWHACRLGSRRPQGHQFQLGQFLGQL